MVGLEIFFEFLTLFSLSLLTLFTISAVLYYKKNMTHTNQNLAGFPFVSILKPLKGLDPRLKENLESFFQQDYPSMEILFGVKDPDDPAIQIVRELINRYPHIPARLIIHSSREKGNPKIIQLTALYRECKGDYILVSDSNVRVEKHFLRNQLKLIQSNNVGLVSTLIRGGSFSSLAGQLENFHLNTSVSLFVLALMQLFNYPVIVGKSMLFSRKALEAIGSFEQFQPFIAEDFLMGMELKKKGYDIAISSEPLYQNNDGWSLRDFWNRHLRWGKLRKSLNSLAYLLESLTNPVSVAIVTTVLFPDFFHLKMLMATVVIRFLLDGYFLINTTRHQLLLLWLSPLKDVIMGMIWYIPLFSNTINWKGQLYQIKRNTRISNL